MPCLHRWVGSRRLLAHCTPSESFLSLFSPHSLQLSGMPLHSCRYSGLQTFLVPLAQSTEKGLWSRTSVLRSWKQETGTQYELSEEWLYSWHNLRDWRALSSYSTWKINLLKWWATPHYKVGKSKSGRWNRGKRQQFPPQQLITDVDNSGESS